MARATHDTSTAFILLLLMLVSLIVVHVTDVSLIRLVPNVGVQWQKWCSMPLYPQLQVIELDAVRAERARSSVL